MPDKTDRPPSAPRSASELVEQKLQALGKGSTTPRMPAMTDGGVEGEALMPAALSGSVGNEMEMIRAIMFGSLQREVDRRLNELSQTIDAFSEMMTERTEQLAHDTDGRLTTGQRESSERLERQAADMNKAQRELSERLEQQISDLRLQMKGLGEDMRQRDDTLRTEIVGLLKAMEDSKTSRTALGDIMVEMGQRLRGDGKK